MGTILTEVSNFDPQIICPNPGEPVRASDTIGTLYLIAGIGVNGGVLYAALSPLARVQHLGGIGMSLSVTVVGNDITVQLATDGMGNVTSTANQVVTAFNANAMATALATATAQGTGTGIAGVNPNFVSIGQDAVGSIRPGFQHFTNRTRYLFNQVNGILFGTLSLKSLNVDGVGGVTIVSSAGDIQASHDITAINSLFAGNRLQVQNNIISLAGNIAALMGNIQAVIGDVLAGNDVSAGHDVIAANELNGDHLQVNRSVSGTTLPNTTVPLGQGNIGNLILGSAIVIGDNGAGTFTFQSGMNVASISRINHGNCQIVFNINATYVFPQVTAMGTSVGTFLPADVLAVWKIISYTPVTIQVGTGTLGGVADVSFSLTISGE